MSGGPYMLAERSINPRPVAGLQCHGYHDYPLLSVDAQHKRSPAKLSIVGQKVHDGLKL